MEKTESCGNMASPEERASNQEACADIAGSSLDAQFPTDLLAFYRSQLLDDVVPFWLRHSLDRSHGGYITMLERDGAPYGYGKYIWPQARGAYLFAKMYNTLDKRSEWLDASELGVTFLEKHALDEHNRAYYKVSREGAPLLARPSEIFAEAFFVVAMSEYALASGKGRYLELAEAVFWAAVERMDNGDSDSHFVAPAFQTKNHAPGMIMMNTAQELRRVNGDERLTERIQKWLHEELYVYARDEQEAMFERVLLDGTPLLSEPEGRSITPGHCAESAWFCMEEGIRLGDQAIVDRAARVLEWTLPLGWDAGHGGICNFLDYEGKPPGHHDEGWGEDQDWDEKLFWVHSETLYALLLAFHATKRELFMGWYRKVHDWAFRHFPDSEYGEWFGYLRHDGSISQTLKGCVKGFFHVPRAFLNCVLLLEGRAGIKIDKGTRHVKTRN